MLPLSALRLSVQADPANVPSLVISQIKITSSGGQFVTLYNTTDSALDMSKYQLEYFNSFDLSKATSSKLIALSGTVPPHGFYMVNDSTMMLCYRLTVDSVSLGFSSTAGMVEVLGFSQSVPGGSVLPQLQDFAGWSKTAAAGVQTLPGGNAFLQRRPLTAQNLPDVTSPGGGTWQNVQPDTTDPCTIISADTADSVPPLGDSGQLLPAAEPPATIVSVPGAQSAAPPSLPAADVGLIAPTVSELLPNPAGTGNDATDEFIELYNPNSAAFDLSGFTLQTGVTSLHHYIIASGRTVPPHGFTALYSSETGLSLSNTSGRAALLDPLGKTLSATDTYGTANDGEAWALAKGKWYWTATPTPGSANSIKQPAAKAKAAKKSKTSKASSVHAGTAATAGSAASAAGDATSLTPIHAWTLALVLGLALLYGLYEYRTDLANRFYQLRRHLGTRRRHRP